jgi:nicotinate-nucleotide adenylyltransferase
MSGRSEQTPRFAIFGGTFDPPHIAHVSLLQQVQKNFSFHRIFVIPSKYPPGKSPSADYETRFEWAQKVFKAPWAEVLPLERGSSQTLFGIDLVAHLQSVNPSAQFSWILGEDQWDSLQYWKRIDEYAFDLQWVVVGRGGSQMKPRGILSRRLNQSSCAYYWLTHEEVDSELDKVASSDLRSAADRQNQSELREDWIPPEIREEVKVYYKNKQTKGGK